MEQITQLTDKKAVRLEILESAIASFKIEGIHISKEAAAKILEKVELRLEKSA